MENVNYKIEKNVPMPSRVYAKAPLSKYPFLHMEVGDSFLVPTKGMTDREINKNKMQIYNRARYLHHHTGINMRFKVLVLQEGIRTWRVS
jgi:hypothetical protein